VCFTRIQVKKPITSSTATAVLPDRTQRIFEPGAARINVRDVPHGAFTVTGDKTLMLLTVHIVDKGKPMTVPVK